MARRAKKSEEVKVSAEEENIESTQEVAEEASEVIEQQVDACGEVLRNERESQGLTGKEVAKQLRLSYRQIESLEANDFAALPEATIVKGFIRNYAKLLDIPAEPLLAGYVAMAPQSTDYSFALNPGINMKISDSDKSNTMRYVLTGLGLLLAAGVWFFYQSYVQKPSPANQTPDIVESLPELALPIAERETETVKTETSNTELAAEKASPTVEGKELKLEKELAVEAETVVANEQAPEEIATAEGEQNAVGETATGDEANEAVATQAEAPAAGTTRLEFNATQETWLSVINTSGREVYNKILYAGNTDVVDVRNPKEIVVGNAHGATLMIDGKAIDLAPYTRINVARVRMNRL